MGRPLRVDYEGAIHHVMNRGTAQTALFRSDDDRRRFIDLVSGIERRFEVEVHALVLMTNHYHLLLRSQSGRLSEAMQWLEGVYVRSFNETHDRVGSLCQGRFSSSPVDDDRYLEQVATYIHRNPVDAGLVERSIDYRWSSLPSYAGRTRCPSWLHTSTVLQGRTGRSYLADVDRGDEEPELKVDVVAMLPAPGPSVASRAETARRLSAVDDLVATTFGVAVDEIHRCAQGRKNTPRQVAIALASDVAHVELTDVASRYGISGPSAVRAARSRVQNDAATGPIVTRLRSHLDLLRIVSDTETQEVGRGGER